ncbi:MAG: hypothetical protein KDE53_14545, partial [Caldilineaceae bacterium]|nr:hypothetical protein [Caldilineaceae bacterium]
ASEIGAGGPFAPVDADGDQIPDYLDPDDTTTDGSGGDSDGDGISDVDECPNGIPCPDSDGDGTPDYNDVSNTLSIKIFLAGAYSRSSDMMRDDLRAKALLPTASPYAGANATVDPALFAVTGSNAIVDWVVVELRDSGNPATVVARRAGLLQRDGDVVSTNGVSAMDFGDHSGDVYVAVRHRNHLAVMTANPVTLAPTVTVDFTTGAGTYGTDAQTLLEAGVYGMWAGDAAGNGNVINAGPGNDVNPILIKVLADAANANLSANYIVEGYAATDVNMDGETIAAGPSNDVNTVLISVFTHPGNSSYAANYIVSEQLPTAP